MLVFMPMLLALHAGVACMQPRPGSTGIQGDFIQVDLNGDIVVLSRDRGLLRKYSGMSVVAEAGGAGWEAGRFDSPAGLWARNGIDIFVADYGNHRVQRFDRNLTFISSFSTRDNENSSLRFGYPTGVALSRQGDLYICDGENSRILKVAGGNRVERFFGGFDAGKGRLKDPRGLEIGPQDRVYVHDGDHIVVFDPFGNYLRHISHESFSPQLLMSADSKGLLVIAGGLLIAMDADDRLRSVTPLAQLFSPPPVEARSMAVARDLLYLLTPEGIITAADPR